MESPYRVAFWTGVLLIVSACGGPLATTPMINNSKSAPASVGVPYSLPRTLLKTRVSVEEIPTDLWMVKLTEEGPAGSRKKFLAALLKQAGWSEARLKEAKAEAGGLPVIVLPAVSRDQAEQARTGLQQAGATILVEPRPTRIRVSLTTEPERVRDPERTYLLRSGDWRSSFFSDEWTIGVSKSGLLERVSLKSRDETGEVIKSLARTAMNIFTFMATGGGGGGGTPGPVPLGGPAVPKTPTVCPPPATEIAQALGSFRGTHDLGPRALGTLFACPADPPADVTGAGACREVIERSDVGSIRVDWRAEKTGAAIPGASKPAIPEDGFDGVFVSLTESVFTRASASLLIDGCVVPLTTIAQTLDAPDEAPVVLVPLHRAAFVEVQHAVEVSEGVLKSVTSTKPSSALAIVRVPEEITGALVDLPARILKLRFDLASQTANIAEQETKLVTEQGDLFEQRSRLLKAKEELQLLAGNTTGADLVQLRTLESELARATALLELLETRKKIQDLEEGIDSSAVDDPL